jgi:hypothetical protein
MAKPWPKRPVSPYQMRTGNKSGKQWRYNQKVPQSARALRSEMRAVAACETAGP